MKVAELIDILQELDKDYVVVLSSDGEGNTFSPVAGFAASYVYAPEQGGSGSLYELEENETLEDFQQTYADAKKAVVLYPIT